MDAPKLEKSVVPAGRQCALLLLASVLAGSLLVNAEQCTSYRRVARERDTLVDTVLLQYERIDVLKAQRANLEADLADLDENWRLIALYDECMVRLGGYRSSSSICYAAVMQLYPLPPH